MFSMCCVFHVLCDDLLLPPHVLQFVLEESRCWSLLAVGDVNLP
jgi:hypothetical protein